MTPPVSGAQEDVGTGHAARDRTATRGPLAVPPHAALERIHTVVVDEHADMEKVVVDMHTRSGLLWAIAESTISLEEAGAQTLSFIKQWAPAVRTVPLCGNSIGTDRRFLAAYLPEIEDWLHYRSVDVSSVKELVRRWYPSVRADLIKKPGAHRALDDIRESVNELRLYRERVFLPAERAEDVTPAT